MARPLTLSLCFDELRSIDATWRAEECDGVGAASAAPVRTPPAIAAGARTEAVSLRIVLLLFDGSMQLPFYDSLCQRRDRWE
jgi:hypothetical protein